MAGTPGVEDENLYGILGVKRTATPAEIQAAYKQKARELHPDVNKSPTAEDDFKRLAAAYAILRDEEKRARYDKYGLSGRPRPEPPPPRPRPQSTRHRPRDFGFGDIRYEDIKVDTDDLNSPFEFILRREKQRQKKKEREVQLNITLEHAFKGTTLNMVLDLPMEDGRTETSRVRLKIPQGAKPGDRLKLKDPDVVVVLSIEPHPRFTLDGRDVSTSLEISPWEAVLGGTVDLETPGGVVHVRIPEGTSSGAKLRLKGQGLPLKPGRDGDPGDMYVTVKVVVPKKLSARERELFEELKQVSDFNPRKG